MTVPTKHEAITTLTNTVASLLLTKHEVAYTVSHVLPDMGETLSWEPENQGNITEVYKGVEEEMVWLSGEFDGLSRVAVRVCNSAEGINKNCQKLVVDVENIIFELDEKAAEFGRKAERLEDEQRSFFESTPMSRKVANRLNEKVENLHDNARILFEKLSSMIDIVLEMLESVSSVNSQSIR